MQSPTDYRNLALECIREADETSDRDRKKTLLGIAKLYNQTALNIEAGSSANPPGVRASEPGQGGDDAH